MQQVGDPDPLPNARTAPPGFLRCLLAVLGVAVAALGARWTFSNPDLGGQNGLAAVTVLLAVLGGSLVLAVTGLGSVRAWRRAGGHGWLSILGIVLASLAIVAVAVAFALAAYGLYAILRVLSEI